jgi:hypothetical protein
MQASRCLVVLAFLLFALFARVADAQQYLIGGSAGLASGIAGGGGATSVLERARTRLRLAIDLRVDEFPKDIFVIGMVAELEPHTSFGLDLRYMRSVSKKIDLNIGAIGFIYPESLIGPVAGLDYHLLLGKIDLVAGPEFNVFIIGTDLPSNSVVWQALLQVGIHVGL